MLYSSQLSFYFNPNRPRVCKDSSSGDEDYAKDIVSVEGIRAMDEIAIVVVHVLMKTGNKGISV